MKYTKTYDTPGEKGSFPEPNKPLNLVIDGVETTGHYKGENTANFIEDGSGKSYSILRYQIEWAYENIKQS